MGGYEKLIEYLMIGVGIFPFVAILFHLIDIPLLWVSFLILYLPLFIIAGAKLTNQDWKFRKSTLCLILAIILSLILFGVYLKGSFGYPYLENDDPWVHALGVKYIATEETAWEPDFLDIHYIDPYPPVYDIFMGVMLQLTNNLMWTMKFFNAVMCGLAILFFYMFAKEFLKDNKKGLLAAFILFCLPCFMSHFIWSQTLAVLLFPIAFYFLEKQRWIPATIVIAGIMVSQSSSAVMFVILGGIYGLIKGFKYLIVVVTGTLLSGVYWFTMFIKYGVGNTLQKIGFSFGLISIKTGDTSGGLIYSIKDFLFPPLMTKMDQPIGVGIVVMILAIYCIWKYIWQASLYLHGSGEHKPAGKKECILIAWVIITLLMVQGNLFPIKLFPHRAWVFFAIPIAFLAAEGLANLKLRHYWIAAILLGILLTSGYPKYFVETSAWPPGVKLAHPSELQGFLYMQQNLPPDTRVYQYGVPYQHFVIAFGMESEPWNKEIYDFTISLNHTSQELHSFLTKHNYEYVILSPMTYMFLVDHGYSEIEILEHLASTINTINPKYIVFNNNIAVIVKVV